MMATFSKSSRPAEGFLHSIPDKATVRTVSRSMKTPEKVLKATEKRISTPQKSPEKSALRRKFALTVMQPAFEQVCLVYFWLIIVATTIEKVAP